MRRFFATELGFDFFRTTRGTARCYLNCDYKFQQILDPQWQTNHVMVYGFQKQVVGGGNISAFYTNDKLPVFYDVVSELSRAGGGRSQKYLDLLNYVTRTFPYVSAYRLSAQGGRLTVKNRYPRNARSPFPTLHDVWNRIPLGAQCRERLDAVLGSIYLLPMDEVNVAGRDYVEGVPGSQDYLVAYHILRERLPACR